MRGLRAFSDRLASLERLLLIACLALLLALILLNVITRSLAASLYWVDEAAVFAMVFICFLGTSMMTRKRMDFAVTLLTDRLSGPARRWIQVTASACTLGFALILITVSWIWFDPGTFASLGFDERRFFRETFNPVYREATATMGIAKVWFFLVVPWFALTLAIHAAANLVEDVSAALGLAELRPHDEVRI